MHATAAADTHLTARLPLAFSTSTRVQIAQWSASRQGNGSRRSSDRHSWRSDAGSTTPPPLPHRRVAPPPPPRTTSMKSSSTKMRAPWAAPSPAGARLTSTCSARRLLSSRSLCISRTRSSRSGRRAPKGKGLTRAPPPHTSHNGSSTSARHPPPTSTAAV